MCDVSTNKKYLTRPSPPRPANDVGCKGKTFIGNDGNLWKSSVTAKGIYRWVKVGATAKKSVERKTKKSVERKETNSVYKISFPLKYIHEKATKPTKSALEAFYKKESYKEVRDILTQYSYPQTIADMVTNVRMTSTGVISFNLPKSISRSEVDAFVNKNIRHAPLADASWEASPGTGLVFTNGNVIGFGAVKIV